MAKLYDENGNEVEGALTKEEIEAAVKTAAEAASTAAVEDYKKNNPPPETKPAADAGGEQTPDPIAELTKQFGEFKESVANERLGVFTDKFAGTDAAKREQFQTEYSRLSGYADTPEGRAEHAAAAAKLAFGTDQPLDIGSFASGAGGRPIGDTKTHTPTKEELEIGSKMGVTEEDRKKFGGAADAAAAEAAGDK